MSTNPVSSEFFLKISRDYVRQTGNSTADLIRDFLPKISNSITPTSIIHDNACGIGTVSFAILSSLSKATHPARIDATDFSEGMISALTSQLTESDDLVLSKIHPRVVDSQALSCFPDSTFDISITNISVSTFLDPSAGLREITRTLKPGGLAVVSHWKRFPVVDIIHAAQKAIRGDDVTLFAMPGREFMEDGYLMERMVECGLGGEVRQEVEKTLIEGEMMQGLKAFMTGPITRKARENWSVEEEGRWEGEIEKGMEEEVKRWGGIMMEAWFVIGRKV